MQRLRTLWQQLTRRLPQRSVAATDTALDTLTQQHGDLTAERWWYWRHYFLEAKRQQLDARRDQ